MKPEPPEEHNDERWMASYMDMVTVLMCLFLVLFAMSSVNEGKFEKLKVSLATGFGTTPSESVDTADGLVVTPELVGNQGEFGATSELLTEVELAQAELDILQRISDMVDASVAAKGLSSAVENTITERGLTIRLVGAETFFSGGSAELTDTAVQVLDAVGVVLATVPNDIGVEGHADPIGQSVGFATDWELSSGRASRVVRFFTDQGSVAPQRASAVGFGSSRPITSDTSATGRALNRRVEVIVQSNQPESVRQLIPGLLAGELATLQTHAGG